MKVKKLFVYLLCVSTVFTLGCLGDDDDFDIDQSQEGTTNGNQDWDDPEIPEDVGDPGDDELVPNTQDISGIVTNPVWIEFSANSASVNNTISGVTVQQDGAHVIITSTRTDIELDYVLSGITTNGTVKIYGEYKFNLYLNGTGIINPDGAAINIQCGKSISVTVVDGTQNRLIDGEEYITVSGEDLKGTFFSEGQLKFYGNGTLEVRGKNKHAICSDDYIRVYEGNIWVKEAASDALHANDYIRIDSGTITTRSTGEGFDCEKGYVRIEGGIITITTLGQKGHGIKSKEYTTINSTDKITITVYGQASKGINSTEDITITQCNMEINTAGDAYWDTDDSDISSAAGIKGDANLLIENGNIVIQSTGKGGKGINISGDIVINDGTISVTTSGDQFVYDRNNDTAAKAIRGKGNVTVNGGDITIRTSKTEVEGMESKATLTITGGNLDIRAYDDCLNASDHIQIDGGNIYCLSAANDGIDSNGTLSITGGTVVSVGTASPEAGLDCDNSRFTITGGTILGLGGDTSTPTASACTQYSVIYKTSSSVSTIHIASTSGGKDILTFNAPVTYSRNTVILFSSPDLESNTGYTIYTGGKISGGSDYFYGLYSGASYTDGSSAGTFTTSSMVSSVGSTSGGGGMGGGRPW